MSKGNQPDDSIERVEGILITWLRRDITYQPPQKKTVKDWVEDLVSG